jgi:hypothetical protein
LARLIREAASGVRGTQRRAERRMQWRRAALRWARVREAKNAKVVMSVIWTSALRAIKQNASPG